MTVLEYAKDLGINLNQTQEFILEQYQKVREEPSIKELLIAQSRLQGRNQLLRIIRSYENSVDKLY